MNARRGHIRRSLDMDMNKPDLEDLQDIAGCVLFALLVVLMLLLT